MKILRKIIGIISLLVVIGASIAILSMPPGDELSIGGIILIFYVGFSMIAGLATSFFFLIFLAIRALMKSRIVAFILLALIMIMGIVGFIKELQILMIFTVITCFAINLYLVYWGLLKKTKKQ